MFLSIGDIPEFEEWNGVWKGKDLAPGRLLFEECSVIGFFLAEITSAADMAVLEKVVEVALVLCVFGILSGHLLVNGLVDGCGDDEAASPFQRET